MERVGVRYLRGIASPASSASSASPFVGPTDHASVVLDLEQRARLDVIRNRVVVHALLVGAVYGMLIGLAEMLVRRGVGLEEGVTDRAVVLRFW